jgi:hypothetical protein
MRNRIAVIAIGAVLTGLLVGVVLAGSGGDGDSTGTDVQPPELTVPVGSGSGGDTTTRERRDRGTTTDSGGATGTDQSTPAPSGEDTGGAAPAQPEDTQQNDTAPPSGSPAQRFEQFCEQNPGAC